MILAQQFFSNYYSNLRLHVINLSQLYSFLWEAINEQNNYERIQARFHSLHPLRTSLFYTVYYTGKLDLKLFSSIGIISQVQEKLRKQVVKSSFKNYLENYEFKMNIWRPPNLSELTPY